LKALCILAYGYVKRNAEAEWVRSLIHHPRKLHIICQTLEKAVLRMKAYKSSYIPASLALKCKLKTNKESLQENQTNRIKLQRGKKERKVKL
jgi:hypothetical protein